MQDPASAGARPNDDATIQLNDFARQWAEVGPATLEAVARVGKSGWYVLGREVRRFEECLATTLGRRNVVGCASGLDAIELALRALGLRSGEKVLTSSLSAFATTLAVVRAGGVPVFVDVDAYGLIDLVQCREILAQDPSIHFVVPVHLYGHVVDLKTLQTLKTEFGVRIVEDCAQAIGAAWEGLPVGAVGDLSALSFYPTKNLGAFGDGGAVLTDDCELTACCRMLRDYGQSGKYQHDVIGLNSRLDELHAAILGEALLPRLREWTARRRAVAAAYLEGLRNPAVRVPGVPPGSDSVWHLFPVLVAPTHRGDFCRRLGECGVSTGVHYPKPISEQTALASVPHQVPRELPNTDEYCRGEVSLPIHPYLSDTEVQRVIHAVNAWQAT